ncbi:MAG: hypothetical protein NC548_34130 [Lachnospiraceae bacterium]|nr:hypothetical protein [Lachnospiraceae bacterium]
MDEMKPLPEDRLNPVYIPSSEGLTITSRLNKDGEYDVTIVGTSVESNILYPDVFGELEIPVVEMGIEIPVICGDTYRVIQENKILRIYEDDPFISHDEEMDLWIKDKEYVMDEDFFKYLFLLDKGRSKIKISFQNLKTGREVIFNIRSHIHFKPQQEEEEPIEPPEENPTPEDPEEPKEPDENEDEDSNG